ncbi:TrbG/VirB9 family P-type conjugative transfer protein [Massilia sp. CCM 9210]|uniref:TrbG/VirB9 family P-type conjugative transfer protein n=1 Tax=Massilia scottii TaxID=3057166 RepID=UPI00279686D1|nr:TrbG/VirB9 family P-type conjugative transfer protein [Massilia sp. CCM 9210]MDQ1817771.1 TrbG/VirB9 family P-type conjugative transfer protein [Massilia sp. CCM 9210]
MKLKLLIATLLAATVSTALASTDVITSNKEYKIMNASAPIFTPVNVWNDGKLTFIELAKPYRGEIPVVFALANDGSRSLVNFQWDEKNSRLVVQRVLDRAILVIGDKSVVVSRT